jgi:RHS repeat-associated protein
MQGQYDDGKTGLYYNTFRYYDADAGRFTVEDPIGLSGGDNLYQYAPNPMVWTDPKGLLDLNLHPRNASNAKARRYVNRIPSVPEFYSVSTHGNSTYIVNRSNKELNPAALANIIRRQPNYKPGTPIALFACNTGTGTNPFAQQLADQLGIRVYAPDNFVWVYSDGEIVVAPPDETEIEPDLARKGTFLVFEPNKQ